MKRLLMGMLVVLALLLLAAPVMAQGNGNTYIGQNLTVRSGETIEGDTALFGGAALLEAGSRLNGDLAVLGGAVTVDGAIDGDLVLFGGSAILGPNAVVEGNVVALGSLERDPAARVRGTVVQGMSAAQALTAPSTPGTRPLAPAMPSAFPQVLALGFGVVRWLVGLAAMALLATIACMTIPAHLQRVGAVMRGAAPQSLGVGLLTVLVLAVLLPLLVIICIGIPVALVLVIALALGVTVGWVAAADLLGDQLVKAVQVKGVSALARTLGGVTVLSVLGLIPCVGWLVGVLVACWGLGATVLTRVGTAEAPSWATPKANAQAPGAPGPGAATADAADVADPQAPATGDTRRLHPPSTDQDDIAGR